LPTSPPQATSSEKPLVLADTRLNDHYGPTNNITAHSSTTLYSSVRWLTSRRSSTTVCTQVERNGESPVAGVRHIQRLSDSVVFQTNSLAAQRNDIYNRRTSSHRFSTYQKAPNFRLPKIEQIRPMCFAKNSSSTRHHRRRRPYGKIRFERRVRGRTNTRRIKAFPFISSQGCRLPIPLTGFRVECGSESLLKADAVCSRTTPETRYSLSLLSERHLPLGKIDERNEEDYQNSNQLFNITGLLDKL
ncbi:hypothetical protein BCV72DRAFT_327693, partial [Rhizopus microsporus var. microsporus]